MLVLERRRIGAYGLCRDGERVLLTRSSALAAFPAVWQVPGGGVEHGEHPAAAVVREFAEETGFDVEVTGIRAVLADVIRLPDLDVALHTDRVVYEVATAGGAGAAGEDPGTTARRTLRGERAGTTDLVAWLSPGELPRLPLMPFTAELLGLPVTPLPEDVPHPTGRHPVAPLPVDRRQRFAAYGLATDPSGRVLLTLIADGYPGAGSWHLPGGGTDHGEQPDTALLRELVEESGQLGRVIGLLDVSHLHTPAAVGPEGFPLDWHGVRAIYRVVVDVPTEARVTEGVGGSTARAGWFSPGEAAALRLTDVAAGALRRIG